jgi:predicted metal-dependent phosphoesterase TrpH
LVLSCFSRGWVLGSGFYGWQLAASLGLQSLWITDHDLIRSLDRTRAIQKHALNVGLSVGFGVEITVEWIAKEHHLLGYFPDSIWKKEALSPAMFV